jgi:hypothetical protein
LIKSDLITEDTDKEDPSELEKKQGSENFVAMLSMVIYFRENNVNPPRFSFNLEEKLMTHSKEHVEIENDDPVWKRYQHEEPITCEFYLKREEYSGPDVPEKRMENGGLDWYSPSLDDSTYFVIYNMDRRTIEPGEQPVISYGGNNNQVLLQHYGFCL